jgi:NDP-sugar pyrophosphorylase family protein
MHDPDTGREWERVFLFTVDTPEDIEDAEAWLRENYPPSEEEGP